MWRSFGDGAAAKDGAEGIFPRHAGAGRSSSCDGNLGQALAGLLGCDDERLEGGSWKICGVCGGFFCESSAAAEFYGSVGWPSPTKIRVPQVREAPNARFSRVGVGSSPGSCNSSLHRRFAGFVGMLHKRQQCRPEPKHVNRTRFALVCGDLKYDFATGDVAVAGQNLPMDVIGSACEIIGDCAQFRWFRSGPFLQRQVCACGANQCES